jgi:hypothetical protein
VPAPCAQHVHVHKQLEKLEGKKPRSRSRNRAARSAGC